MPFFLKIRNCLLKRYSVCKCFKATDLQRRAPPEQLLIVTNLSLLVPIDAFDFCLEYDISTGRAGHPLVSCEIRLIDWNEGQYRTTDKPNPRGEVLIGGKVVADSYFGEAAKENDNFEEINGTRYFHTGDIGEVFPDGTLKLIGQSLLYFQSVLSSCPIVDRKKDVVKIRGGKYVSLAKIEMAINKISMIDNCCVFASSSKEHTVALICPNSKDMEVRFHPDLL